MTQLHRVFILLCLLLSCGMQTTANADSLAQEVESIYQSKLKDLFLLYGKSHLIKVGCSIFPLVIQKTTSKSLRFGL